MNDTRCALASAELAEPLLGTAPEADAFLLVEVRGKWAPKILDTELPEGVRVTLADAEARHPGLRLQFIRAPRRTEGPLAVYLCRVGAFLSRVELKDLEQLRALDLDAWLATGQVPGAARLDHALTLVCTHGRRDVCCALLGNPVFDALTRLSADVGGCPSVWQASHLGGHRFAPVLLSLPDGHCYGRVGVGEASAFLSAQAAQRVHTPARLRGRTCDPAWLQAATTAARMATDLRAFDALAGAQVEHDGPRRHVSVPTQSGEVRVTLAQETRADVARPASCGDTPGPLVYWRADVSR